MGSNLFTSALSAMNAAQAGMATTQHNIANASTPGFTRQEVLIGSRAGQQTGAGFVGAGVDVAGVIRIYDQYLTNQVRLEQTQSNYLSTYHSAMAQIDNLIADPTAGASPAMQDFFNALNGVANNPESIPARQTLLGTSQFVVNRFQAIDQRLTDISDGLNDQITRSIGTVNNYAQQIAALNGNIKRAIANGQGQMPNDLLDQRDQIINELNKEIKVSVQLQYDGSANVYVGNGQTLVIDEKAKNLGAVRSETDPSKLDIVYRDGNKTTLLQQSGLQGGNLGAYLAFRDQSLEPARNALGRVAMGLATKMNEQNQMGLDLNGAAGGKIFNVGVPRVELGTKNTGSAVASATISDVTQLTTSDYQLRYDGDNYTMVRLLDNTSTNVGTTAAPPSNVTMDGFTFSLFGAAVKGDTFLIRPTADGARDIRVAMSNPAKIAAAAPVRSNADLVNTGSGAISAPVVTSGLPLDANLQSPVTLTFNTPTTTYSLTSTTVAIGADIATVPPMSNVTVSSTANMVIGGSVTGGGFPAGTTVLSIDPDGITFVAQMPIGGTNTAVPKTGQTLAADYTYTSGTDISYNGWTAQISGTPAAGDVFTVGANTGATGDNRNALLLSGMQNQNLMADNTATFQGLYGQLVGEIGSKTHELAVTSQAQISMTAQTIAQQQSVSGVNLDEEAANLMLYQRAYQAAAKAMQVANTMFDALLAIGR